MCGSHPRLAESSSESGYQYFLFIRLFACMVGWLVVFLFVDSPDGVCLLQLRSQMTSLIFLFTGCDSGQVTLLESSEFISLAEQ